MRCPCRPGRTALSNAMPNIGIADAMSASSWNLPLTPHLDLILSSRMPSLQASSTVVQHNCFLCAKRVPDCAAQPAEESLKQQRPWPHCAFAR